MLKQSEAIKQINRLAGMPGFASASGPMAAGDSALDELIRALKKFPNAEMAEEAISDWLQNHHWLPVPADLYRMAESAANAIGIVRPDGKCKACGGSGFERILVLVTFLRHPSGAGKALEERQIALDVAETIRASLPADQRIECAMRPCGCEYGQFLKAGRNQYEIEQAENTRKGKR